MEGRIIAGRYRLVRVLGRGGMGAVWLAEHVSLGTSVAIKLINSELANHPEARSRFAREAQLAARIRSVHVAQIHDHGLTEEGAPYIAMECLAGESLSERLVLRGRLTLPETARIISHVCRGVARAHEAGLVHRDLKPENIFIAREGSDEIVKVLDFGVAKATDALAAGYEKTRTGALLGTPHYMSPEQAQGLKTIDGRSDLWSLGIVAFECITGSRPFVAAALGPLIAQVVGAPIPVPSKVAPDAGIPPELDAWMTRALARDPAQRFASAEELSQSFMTAAAVVDSFPIGVQPASGMPSAAPAAFHVSSGPPPAASSPAEIAPTLAGTASAHVRIAERDAASAPTLAARTNDADAPDTLLDPAPRTPPRARSARWLVVGALLLVAAGAVGFFLRH